MIRPHAIPAAAAAILLLVGLGHHPYGYYTFLRWAVTVAAVVVAISSWKSSTQWAAWPFAAIAILFNPIEPVYMTRQAWRPIDIACAVAFLVSLKIETTSGADIAPSAGPVSRTKRAASLPALGAQGLVANLAAACCCGATTALVWIEVNGVGIEVYHVGTRGYEMTGGRVVLAASVVGVVVVLVSVAAGRLLRLVRWIEFLAAVASIGAVVATMSTYKPTVTGSWRVDAGAWVTLGVAIAWAIVGLVTAIGSSGRAVLRRAPSEKVCPDCAETVKAAARICRYCRYEFE